MNIADLISKPRDLNEETLVELRQIVARYPYFQAGRLLLLKNLFLMKNEAFQQEMMSSSAFIPDQRVLFNLVEGKNYRISPRKEAEINDVSKDMDRSERTASLIDDFLQFSPPEKSSRNSVSASPSAVNIGTDYAAYLEQLENEERKEEPETTSSSSLSEFPFNYGEDSEQESEEKLQLKDEIIYTPELESEDDDSELKEEYFTETLASIYIKQAKYEKAIEIIRRLYLNNPKKNSYFADQIRFLEKLILNQKNADRHKKDTLEGK